MKDHHSTTTAKYVHYSVTHGYTLSDGRSSSLSNGNYNVRVSFMSMRGSVPEGSGSTAGFYITDLQGGTRTVIMNA